MSNHKYNIKYRGVKKYVIPVYDPNGSFCDPLGVYVHKCIGQVYIHSRKKGYLKNDGLRRYEYVNSSNGTIFFNILIRMGRCQICIGLEEFH